MCNYIENKGRVVCNDYGSVKKFKRMYCLCSGVGQNRTGVTVLSGHSEVKAHIKHETYGFTGSKIEAKVGGVCKSPLLYLVSSTCSQYFFF